MEEKGAGRGWAVGARPVGEGDLLKKLWALGLILRDDEVTVAKLFGCRIFAVVVALRD